MCLFFKLPCRWRWLQQLSWLRHMYWWVPSWLLERTLCKSSELSPHGSSLSSLTHKFQPPGPPWGSETTLFRCSFLGCSWEILSRQCARTILGFTLLVFLLLPAVQWLKTDVLHTFSCFIIHCIQRRLNPDPVVSSWPRAQALQYASKLSLYCKFNIPVSSRENLSSFFFLF